MEKQQLLFFLTISVLSLLSSSKAAEATATVAWREFDYFSFALQWPGTICASTHKCCAKNGCCRSEPLSWFTIHGLWPDYDDGSWPSCCTQTSFDMTKVSSLLPELNKYWPSLYCSTSSTCFSGKGLFWAHEWEKHGTCSYPVTKDEYDYFSTALDLYHKYNVTRMLEKAGIYGTNGETYTLTEITNAIESDFGATPLLVCTHGSLEELRLCFTKDFKPRNCDTGSAMTSGLLKSSCPGSISLPTYEPLVLGNTGDATSAIDELLLGSLALPTL